MPETEVVDGKCEHSEGEFLISIYAHLCANRTLCPCLFVCMCLSWVQPALMTASVKWGFGWQRKESLYL